MAALTSKELAKVTPNRSGTRGVHPRTIERRVKLGHLPPFDFEFEDGTKGWTGARLQHERIAPFIDGDNVRPDQRALSAA